MYEEVTHEITLDPTHSDFVEVRFNVPVTLAHGTTRRVDLKAPRLEPEILPLFEQLFATGEIDTVTVIGQGHLWRIKARRAQRRGRVRNQLETILAALPDQVAVVSDDELHTFLQGSLREAFEAIFETNNASGEVEEAIKAYHEARHQRALEVAPAAFLKQEGSQWPHSPNFQTALMQDYAIPSTIQRVARNRGGIAVSCMEAIRNPASGGPLQLAVRRLDGKPID